MQTSSTTVGLALMVAVGCFFAGYMVGPAQQHRAPPVIRHTEPTQVCPVCPACPVTSRDSDREHKFTAEKLRLESEKRAAEDRLECTAREVAERERREVAERQLRECKRDAEKKKGQGQCAVPNGHPENPCNTEKPWKGRLPMSYNKDLYEGKEFVNSSYDPEHPWKPTTYRPRRAVHPLLRALDIRVTEEMMATFLSKANIPNSVLVEVGVFDGANTVNFGRIASVRKIYSFEPTTGKLQGIRDKIAQANIGGKVELHHAAVTNYTGKAKFYTPKGSGGSQMDSLSKNNDLPTDEYVEVDAVRLDEVVKEHVDFMITDTQGNELNVLLGAEKLIDTYGIDMIIIEYSPLLAHYNEQHLGDMLQFMWDKGYLCFDNGGFSWFPNLPFGTPEQRELGVYSFLFQDPTKGAQDKWQGTFFDVLCMKVR